MSDCKTKPIILIDLNTFLPNKIDYFFLSKTFEIINNFIYLLLIITSYRNDSTILILYHHYHSLC